jgi:hypothetical protein
LKQKQFKALVICNPPAERNGRFRAGRHWPTGKTEEWISEETLKALQDDKMDESLQKMVGGNLVEGKQSRSFFIVQILDERYVEVADTKPAESSLAPVPSPASQVVSPEDIFDLRRSISRLGERTERLEDGISQANQENQFLINQNDSLRSDLAAKDKELADLRAMLEKQTSPTT